MSGEDAVAFDVDERGDGRPVVFVHGLTFDRALLREASEPIFAGLPAHRAYLDLPGHGASPVDARAGSAEGLVQALIAYVDARCAVPPVIVGHSYGAYLALGVAAQRRLAGLVLVTPVIEPDVARRVVPARRVAVRDEGLVYLPGAPERETFEEIAVAQTAPVLAAYQRLVHPASERTDRELLAAIRARYVLPGPLLGRIAQLAPPTLVVCGRDDHWAGFEDTLPLLRALPTAELAVLPGCGQLLPLEAGDRYRALVGGFIRGLSAS